MRRQRRRRVATRGGGSPALPLGGVPGHQHDHRLAQNVEGAHALVTEGSRGAIVPRRRPAPEGGGAAAPASSWRRQNAQEKGISSRGFCSLEGKAPGEETLRRRWIRRRSGGRGPKLQALRDPGDGFPWTTSVA
jgi:hypothetical protein